MTLDQIHFRLCDVDLLKKPLGRRTKTMKSEAALGTITPNKDGSFKAQSSDGKTITLKSKGKSKAKMIREQKERERMEQEKKKKLRK